MRFAYLILAHDAFDQLELLCARLLRDGEEDRVFIHIDAKAAAPRHFLARLEPELASRVTMLSNRIAVYWGHQSQCQATLRLLEASLGHQADFFHLLSGRDWPLVPRERIVADIEAAPPGTCFIDIDGPQDAERMDGYALGDRRLAPTRATNALLWRYDRLVHKLSGLVEGMQRRRGRARGQPFGPWVKGSQWWSLPREAAQLARDGLAALAEEQRLRFTRCSDEHAVQTILFNSDFRDRLQANRRLIVWPQGADSPIRLGPREVAAARGCWFGRKFAIEEDRFFLQL